MIDPRLYESSPHPLAFAAGWLCQCGSGALLGEAPANCPLCGVAFAPADPVCRVKLSPAQVSALECREGGGLDPIIDDAWDGFGLLTFTEGYREPLWGARRDASNAEDSGADEATDPAERRAARQAARSLGCVAGHVLTASGK